MIKWKGGDDEQEAKAGCVNVTVKNVDDWELDALYEIRIYGTCIKSNLLRVMKFSATKRAAERELRKIYNAIGKILGEEK